MGSDTQAPAQWSLGARYHETRRCPKPPLPLSYAAQNPYRYETSICSKSNAFLHGPHLRRSTESQRQKHLLRSGWSLPFEGENPLPTTMLRWMTRSGWIRAGSAHSAMHRCPQGTRHHKSNERQSNAAAASRGPLEAMVGLRSPPEGMAYCQSHAATREGTAILPGEMPPRI